jgi:hypothetical protein
MSSQDFVAFVSWPSAPLTDSLVRNALSKLSPPPQLVSLQQRHPRLLQWSTYDEIDHDLSHSEPGILASSYIIRKALIRKHYLSRCIHAYTTKNASSKLVRGVPQSWDIEISFADELEDMWSDELWDLAQKLSPERWWILKPGMADRGMGIRLFNNQEDLQRIFEEFEGDIDEEGEEAEENATAVVTSQLRHFVIQACIPNACVRILSLIRSIRNTLPIPYWWILTMCHSMVLQGRTTKRQGTVIKSVNHSTTSLNKMSRFVVSFTFAHTAWLRVLLEFTSTNESWPSSLQFHIPLQ